MLIRIKKKKKSSKKSKSSPKLGTFAKALKETFSNMGKFFLTLRKKKKSDFNFLSLVFLLQYKSNPRKR